MTSMREPPSLRQVNRTQVEWRGRLLAYFGGCDYFRLATHPEVLRAAGETLDSDGLNVAASRLTTGNHPIYGELERELARFFRSPAALVVSTGYTANLAVAQGVCGMFSHAWIDEKAHPALQDAATFLGCPVRTFRHRDAGSLAKGVRRLKRGARPVLLTDGLFAASGEFAPLKTYLSVLPAGAMLWIDEAHSAATIGATGGGSVELHGVPAARTIRTGTLSKAFGSYGGMILGSRELRGRILERSRFFLGSTPVPLPLAGAALRAVRIVKSDPGLRERLAANVARVRSALATAGIAVPEFPSPIVPFVPGNAAAAARLKRNLLARSVFPSQIRYAGGPPEGFFRFAISSEHTAPQLGALIEALTC